MEENLQGNANLANNVNSSDNANPAETPVQNNADFEQNSQNAQENANQGQNPKDKPLTQKDFDRIYWEKSELDRRNKRLEDEVKLLGGKLNEIVENTYSQNEDNVNAQLNDIDLQMENAFKNANLEAIPSLIKKRDTLKEQKTKLQIEKEKSRQIQQSQPKQQNVADTPEYIAFAQRNAAWLDVDPKKTNYAIFVGEQIKKTFQGTEAQFLAEIEKQVNEVFPQQQGRVPVSNVTGSSGTGFVNNANSHDELVTLDQSDWDVIKKAGIDPKKYQYAKTQRVRRGEY